MSVCPSLCALLGDTPTPASEAQAWPRRVVALQEGLVLLGDDFSLSLWDARGLRRLECLPEAQDVCLLPKDAHGTWDAEGDSEESSDLLLALTRPSGVACVLDPASDRVLSEVDDLRSTSEAGLGKLSTSFERVASGSGHVVLLDVHGQGRERESRHFRSDRN